MISAETSKLLNRLISFGVGSLRQEFTAQGHSATGHAINNIKGELIQMDGGVEVAFFAPEYATRLNNWQSPSTININEWRLRVWMALPTRGIPKKAYYPITRAMMREGIPTKGSFKFSQNGRRTGWVQFPADQFIFPAADQLADQLAMNVLNEVAASLLQTLSDL